MQLLARKLQPTARLDAPCLPKWVASTMNPDSLPLPGKARNGSGLTSQLRPNLFPGDGYEINFVERGIFLQLPIACPAIDKPLIERLLRLQP